MLGKPEGRGGAGQGQGRAGQGETVEGLGSRQIAQSRLVGEHGGGGLIGFRPGGLRQVDLPKGDQIRNVPALLHGGVVLLLWHKLQLGLLIHDFLYLVADEVVERIELRETRGRTWGRSILAGKGFELGCKEPAAARGPSPRSRLK